MRTKNFVIAGIAGGITDFLLGWLFYGMLFMDYFGAGEPNLALIFMGCLSFGFLMSYIIVRWANLVSMSAGLKAGAVIGFIMGLMNNFFMWSDDKVVDWEKFLVDVGICTAIGLCVGAVVAAINGALSKT